MSCGTTRQASWSSWFLHSQNGGLSLACTTKTKMRPGDWLALPNRALPTNVERHIKTGNVQKRVKPCMISEEHTLKKSVLCRVASYEPRCKTHWGVLPYQHYSYTAIIQQQPLRPSVACSMHERRTLHRADSMWTIRVAQSWESRSTQPRSPRNHHTAGKPQSDCSQNTPIASGKRFCRE